METSVHTTPAAAAHLKRRRRMDDGLRLLGLVAIFFALLALVVLLYTIVSKASNAVYEYRVTLPSVEIPEDAFDPAFEERTRTQIYRLVPRVFTPTKAEAEIARKVSIQRLRDANAIAAEAAANLFPFAHEDSKAELGGLISVAVGGALARQVREGEIRPGEPLTAVPALLSDEAQLYFKGEYGRPQPMDTEGVGLTIAEGEGDALSLSADRPVFAELLAGARRVLREQARRLEEEALRRRNAVAVAEAALDAADEASRSEAQRALDAAEARLTEVAAEAADLRARAEAQGGFEPLTDRMTSAFIRVEAGWIKLTGVGEAEATGRMLLPLHQDPAEGAYADEAWSLSRIGRAPMLGFGGFDPTPEAERASAGATDLRLAALATLEQEGEIQSAVAWGFFFKNTDSREAEEAGVLGALVGSAWTMLVTLIGATIVGVATGLYLQEFARRRTRFADLIEVNLSNLAAVPSIIFGLFGLMFLLTGFEVWGVRIGGWFAEMRSFPIIGGTVLALMTLPTIVIATRAALRSVPAHVRQGAYGMGASPTQVVLHHVLPGAAPGILTGVIIGMAQALGETAPLIMIGMIGFFQAVPESAFESATVMPGLIFSWSDHPEALFEYKTSLAIVALLVFLAIMNGLAIYLRRRFETRW